VSVLGAVRRFIPRGRALLRLYPLALCVMYIRY
jgi:hypothetical protein